MINLNEKDFLKHPVLSEFHSITRIPRPSGHEEKISTYLVNWANNENLIVEKDPWNNVFIKKEASSGYENISPIALQAHMDMVCEKNEDVNHDFLNDPIEYFIDDDIVSTHNKTTLGADNGIGLALALSILKNKDLKHPELEVIFTTDEEENFTGATNFDISSLKSNYLINIDHACEDELVCASAGGIGVKSFRDIEYTKIKENFSNYKISLTGLKGGHSGEDIHKGHGNSNILLFRLLNSFSKDFQLLNIKGGSFRLAIPRESFVNISIDENNINYFLSEITSFKEKLITEFPSCKDSLKITLEKSNLNSLAIDENTKNDLINLVLSYPNGIQEMSDVFDNLVKSSINLGEIYIEDNKIYLVSEIRSLNENDIDNILNKANIITKAFNFNFLSFGRYFSWSYKDNSKLRELATNVFSKVQNQKINSLAVHAGLECGFFLEKKPSLDIISIGPNCKYFHSPSEEFSISSVDKVYKSLVSLLENINF